MSKARKVEACKGDVILKKVQIISICVLIITLIVMGVNKFLFSLPDWAIRIDGVIMVAGIFAVVYSTVKCTKGDS